MIPASYLAMLAEASYTSQATYERFDIHGIRTDRDGTPIVTFRGTNDAIALWRDLCAVGLATFDHPELGPIHADIFDGVMQVFEAIDHDLGDAPAIFNGHSKGGLEAQYAAALRRLRGRPVAGIWTLGAPRGGSLKGLLLDAPGADFRHGHDPIPELPSWLGHPRPTTPLAEGKPPPILDFFKICDHRIASYRAALPA